MTRLKEILDFLERDLSDASRQYDWDNSGRQIHLGDRAVSKAAFALDPSKTVIQKAIKEGCEILITHHPFFLRPTKALSVDETHGRSAIEAIQAGLDIASYHTSLDLADGGLNDYMVEILDAENQGIFAKEGGTALYKYAVYVPKENLTDVADAADRAGAGHIGEYSGCAFRTEGTGSFRPSDAANPHIGTRGELEEVSEYKFETIVPSDKLAGLIKAVNEAHPYEEVAFDVYRLEQDIPYGLGRIGRFSCEMPLDDILKLLAEKLGNDNIRHNGQGTEKFGRFAVVTGSGASMWKQCLKKGVKLLITGDMKHHDALDAKEAGICIIDAGHFETERIFMKHLADIVKDKFGVDTVVIEEKSAIKNRGF